MVFTSLRTGPRSGSRKKSTRAMPEQRRAMKARAASSWNSTVVSGSRFGFVDQLGAVVLVLPCVVVEVPARPDLAGPRHLGYQVAQDGQFDLPTINCPLDDQSLVVASRCFQRHFEGRRVVGPRHPDRRT